MPRVKTPFGLGIGSMQLTPRTNVGRGFDLRLSGFIPDTVNWSLGFRSIWLEPLLMLIRSFNFRFSAVLLLTMDWEFSPLSEEGMSCGLASLFGLGFLLGLPLLAPAGLRIGLFSFPDDVLTLGLGPRTGVLFLIGVGLSSG